MTAPQPRQKYKKIRLYPIPARGNGKSTVEKARWKKHGGKSTVEEGELKWVH